METLTLTINIFTLKKTQHFTFPYYFINYILLFYVDWTMRMLYSHNIIYVFSIHSTSPDNITLFIIIVL